jgi:hypothetical protein
MSQPHWNMQNDLAGKIRDGAIELLNQQLADALAERAVEHRHADKLQPVGKIATGPIGLKAKASADSIEHLNQPLADTRTLRDRYKKRHWQVAGHHYQLQLPFDKRHWWQDHLVDVPASVFNYSPMQNWIVISVNWAVTRTRARMKGMWLCHVGFN